MVLILALLGAAIALFLLTILAAKRPFRRADVFLALWLVAQGGAFSAVAITASSPNLSPLIILSLGQFLLFSLGPIQLLYARGALDTPLRLERQLAALIAVALLLCLLPILISMDTRSGAIVVTQAPFWLLAVPPLALVLSALWPLAVLRLARQARQRIKDRYSSLSGIDPGWIEVWALSSLIVIALSLTAQLNSVFQLLPIPVHVSLLLAVQVMQLAYVAHRGLTRAGIFQGGLSRTASRPTKVDHEAAKADYDSAMNHLADTRLYLDEGLTAPALADSIGWAPERLTTAFREGGNTNFHDAIFKARLGEMERLARDPANKRVTTLALGFDSGFGSKSAMYDAFRRELGQSPAAWRKSLNDS